MPTEYSLQNPHTLLAVDEMPGGGTLSRVFNFAAEQVTTIYREKAQLNDAVKTYESAGGNAVAVSVALTSQMQVQKFSELDSQAEIELMRAELVSQGGTPPVKDDMPGKQRIKPVSVANGPISKL